MKDVATNTVRRSGGLRIKSRARWELFKVRATLCAIPARGDPCPSCMMAHKELAWKAKR
jgi:hypothetical protein